MKIVMVNKYYYLRGGTETYMFGLAELLKKAGHEVLFFAMKDDRNRQCPQEGYFVENVDFDKPLSVKEKILAGFRMIYSIEAKEKFSKLLDDEKPDIVHVNLFHRVLTASVIDAAYERGIPIVFTMHDLNCICPNHMMLDHGRCCEACLGKGRYMNCVRRRCLKDSRLKCLAAAAESTFNLHHRVYKKISLYITPSVFYKKILGESGITTSRIVHMKNFLPEEIMRDSASYMGDYVLYYGRLSPEKGIMTLIRAVSMLPDLKLVIAGNGSEEKRLREEVSRLNLEERVIFAGFKEGPALWGLVDGSLCAAVPSEWYEASGYTACEAQARGKPVVAANVGGLPENIIDKETGYLFSPGNAEELAEKLRKVAEMSEKEYAVMSEKAYKNARRLFDPQRYVERLIEEYSMAADIAVRRS